MAGRDARHPDDVGPLSAGGDHRGDETSPPPPPSVDPGRVRHYAAFYGLEPLPEGGPLAVVHGNCQAESLRVALAGDDLVTIRIPPVHELAAADLPHLDRLLRRVDVLVTQPVRDGYRGLPLGTAQLTGRLAPGARVVRVPVIRFAGLYPAQAIIRPPSDPSLVPPIAPYHDLRVLAQAAGLGLERLSAPLERRAIRALAELSRRALRTREQAHGTLAVSDLFDRPSFDQMRTINHPGNPVWEPVARRVRERLGLTDGPAPARPLLDAIHAPREPAVIAALRLEAEPRGHWWIGERAVDPGEVAAAHLAWYRAHPDAVSEGVRRHRTTLQILAGR